MAKAIKQPVVAAFQKTETSHITTYPVRDYAVQIAAGMMAHQNPSKDLPAVARRAVLLVKAILAECDQQDATKP